jgi:ribosomal protein S18 acetylase RimI-like enzyme
MAFNNIKIQRATIADLENLVVLFKKYMQFYKKNTNTVKVRNFLQKRIQMDEATILMAYSEESNHNPLAFVLLYPGFSSLSLGKIYILNDLYVEEYARRSGIARKLIDASRDLAKKENVIRLDLSTANNNMEAQKLYELYGFKKDEIFSNYSYSLN